MVTVKSLFAAAATIHFDEILVKNLLSKICVLLQLLFKGGYYLSAATNNDFTVFCSLFRLFCEHFLKDGE